MTHYFLLVMIQSCETEKVAQRSEAELNCYNSFSFYMRSDLVGRFP